MIKCVDRGIWTCISNSGVLKKSYDNSDAAISAAKLVNKYDPKETTKLVAYKCTHCHKYHLLTVNKKKLNNIVRWRNWKDAKLKAVRMEWEGGYDTQVG